MTNQRSSDWTPPPDADALPAPGPVDLDARAGDGEGVASATGASDVIVAEASNIHSASAPILIPMLARRRPGLKAPQPARAPARLGPRVALGAICAVLLVSMIAGGRERIVARVPSADRVFAAIGLPVNLAGVEFRNVVSKVTEIDGQKVLAVNGEVANLNRAATTSFPALKMTVRGADGRALYVWTANAVTSKLAPGETTTFRTRLAAPPDGARDVLVSLAEPAKPIAASSMKARSKDGVGKDASAEPLKSARGKLASQ
jgi:hypothetical protein